MVKQRKEEVERSNVTDDKSARSSMRVAIVAGAFAILGGVVGSFTSSQLAFRNEVRGKVIEQRQHAYAAIMGKKFLLKQLYVSRFEALIFSDYHEYRWNLAGRPANSLDLEETKRWMHKSEDMAIDIARANESLFESLGVVKTVFPRSEELNRLNNRIYHFKTPIIMPPENRSDEQALEIWKQEAVRQLQKLVDEEYGVPIDALLEHLEAKMYEGIS